jgi:hypothetical protein
MSTHNEDRLAFLKQTLASVKGTLEHLNSKTDADSRQQAKGFQKSYNEIKAQIHRLTASKDAVAPSKALIKGSTGFKVAEELCKSLPEHITRMKEDMSEDHELTAKLLELYHAAAKAVESAQ